MTATLILHRAINLMRLLALLFILLPATAWSSIGTISEFTGSGVLERDSNTIDGAVDLGVESMDTAVTAKGRMRIDFIDDTRVDITEHSRLIIDEFVYDPANDIGSLSVKASLGTVRYASGQIAKKYRQNVKIRTPSAVIGVRGTDFVMVVDEAGGSMITLLPSCIVNPITRKAECITGEISVETDAGFVIMNQAFQTTMVQNTWQKPTPPLILDIPENMINALLVVRKVHPYDEEWAELLKQRRELMDFLGFDFLEFDILDQDLLLADIRDIWLTDLDRNAMYLNELLHDMIDQLNKALAALLANELNKQNNRFYNVEQQGYDPETRTYLEFVPPYWEFKRTDLGNYHNTELKLDRDGGYTINIKQQDEQIFDYRIGIGTNNIDIEQVQ